MILLDSNGKERWRVEGYLPNRDFMAALQSGLGRIAFVTKQYPHAERWYGQVTKDFADSHFAPEAMYWKAVAHYRATHDHEVLGDAAQQLQRSYPESLWAMKATPWLPTGS